MRFMPIAGVIALAALAPAAAVGSSLPSDFPRYEIDSLCSAWAAREAAGAEAARKSCVSMNQDGYDFARAVWPAASPDLRARCVALADKQPHLPYEALANCLDRLLPAEDLQRQGPFRY